MLVLPHTFYAICSVWLHIDVLQSRRIECIELRWEIEIQWCGRWWWHQLMKVLVPVQFDQSMMQCSSWILMPGSATMGASLGDASVMIMIGIWWLLGSVSKKIAFEVPIDCHLRCNQSQLIMEFKQITYRLILEYDEITIDTVQLKLSMMVREYLHYLIDRLLSASFYSDFMYLWIQI